MVYSHGVSSAAHTMRTDTNPYAGDARRKEGLMASTLTVRITRTVRFRGGRTIERGAILAATFAPADEYTSAGYSVAHPSGIEGAYAFIPAAHAEVVA